MQPLFHPNLRLHNASSQIEGAYRVGAFQKKVPANFQSYMQMARALSQRIYGANYMRKLHRACEVQGIWAEVKLSTTSYEAIITSVALALAAADSQAFAVTRPPGHHSSPGKAVGFCFLNNIGLATHHLLEQGNKVFIIDFDGHHGNGTEEMFYENNQVYFCSIHQADVFPFSGSDARRGAGVGYGFNLNLPLKARARDSDLIDSFQIALREARTFQPDIIGISAGFDGHQNDPLLDLKFTTQGYRRIGELLRDFGLPFFGVLEGGYHSNLAECVYAFLCQD